MKNIVLAAGYATRLYPLTENFPKPLLMVGGKTILDWLLEDIDQIDEIDEHLIVTNHKFIRHFEEWKKNSSYQKKITLVDDGSTDNNNRLGAVNDLLLAIQTQELGNDDLLVLAADNLVDFSFRGFVDAFTKQQSSMIMCHYEPALEALQKTGVITLDNNNRVLEMQEKPQQPKSNWAVPPFYIYRKEDIPRIKECIAEGCAADAPGSLVNAMLLKIPFYAWEMAGKRIDIGTLDNYHQLKDQNWR